jgi:histidinol-phosphate phosphatase family protein
MRLRPLTDARPKPMIEFHGRPFLDYLVEQLRDQGFQRILMLLGYLPEVVQQHFGDGRDFGIDIEYVVSEPDDLTARRMRLAADHLDPWFLLLYCDNYWPLLFERMWARFRATGARAMVTVYANADGYSRDNVRVDGDGWVRAFDRSRQMPGLRGVEIGYAITSRDLLELLPPEDELWEQAVYPALVEEGALAAWVTGHRYYSVGSHERLPLTEQFLSRRPAIILDRDGVLNRRPPRAHYVRSPEEFEWLPGAREALRLFVEHGHQIVVVSNQAGVARGAMTAEDLTRVHARMRREAKEAGGAIDAVYHCPHGWDEGCECRKPRPGMLFAAQRDLALDLSRTVFVGDDERDAQAAEAAGCRSVMVTDETSLLDVGRELLTVGDPAGSRS